MGELRHPLPPLQLLDLGWVEIGKEETKALNALQDYFLRLLWGTGPEAPKVALRADTATRSMEEKNNACLPHQPHG